MAPRTVLSFAARGNRKDRYGAHRNGGGAAAAVIIDQRCLVPPTSPWLAPRFSR